MTPPDVSPDFCGRGTVLAVANSLNLPAIGVDIDAGCVKAAARLQVERLLPSDTISEAGF